MTQQLKKYFKNQVRLKNVWGNPICYYAALPESFASPLLQSDCPPPPPHRIFYCFHFLLFPWFPQWITVYSLSGQILCSANWQTDSALVSFLAGWTISLTPSSSSRGSWLHMNHSFHFYKLVSHCHLHAHSHLLCCSRIKTAACNWCLLCRTDQVCGWH